MTTRQKRLDLIHPGEILLEDLMAMLMLRRPGGCQA